MEVTEAKWISAQLLVDEWSYEPAVLEECSEVVPRSKLRKQFLSSFDEASSRAQAASCGHLHLIQGADLIQKYFLYTNLALQQFRSQ